MLSTGDNVSSKRVAGLLCLLIYFCIFVSSYWIEPNIELSKGFLYVGAGLLGSTVIKDFKTTKNN